MNGLVDICTPGLIPLYPFYFHSKLDSGPLSASLLSDWLEVRFMNTEDMLAVQEELLNDEVRKVYS